MNRFAVWLIFCVLWWRIENKSDALLMRYTRRYWASVDGLIKFGLTATLAFILIVFVLAFDDTCGWFGCETRLSGFLNAPANEVGDTLAGLAGGLAFLWLVVTVLLQGKELAAQREELRLARVESSKMATALEAQAEVFRDEQKQRIEDRNKLFVDEQLKLAVDIMFYYQPNMRFFVRTPSKQANERKGWVDVVAKDRIRVSLFGTKKFGEDTDKNFQEISQDLWWVKEFLVKNRSSLDIEKKLGRRNRFDQVFETIDEIQKVASNLSESQKSRLRRIRLDSALNTLSEIRALEIWSEKVEP